jgi:hypothetical protein
VKVSVVIPSRNERFLAQTVASVLKQARGDVEVIVALDGYWPEPYAASDGTVHEVPWADPRIRALHFGKPQGMRPMINAASLVATGDFLMKLDAHCDVSEGFDLTLQEEVDKYTVAIPRRYRLDPERWAWQEVHKPPIDYHYLSYPFTGEAGAGLHGTVWTSRAQQRAHLEIDEEMSSQGSCWFMQRKHFAHRLYPLDVERYGNFVQEFQEIGMKTWLGGGQVLINKRAWYAHLHKGKTYGRGYFISKAEMQKGQDAALAYWFYDKWPGRKHDLSWLIDKFWPVPGWPGNWEQVRNMKEQRHETATATTTTETGAEETRDDHQGDRSEGV